MNFVRLYAFIVVIGTIVGAAPANAGVMIFTSSNTFVVPTSVTSVHVLAIGGGGGGANGHQGGGGAGFLSFGTFTVTPGDNIAVIVGTGGTGAVSRSDNNIVGLTAGTASSFGSLLTANGGRVVTGINLGGQNGSSGGGGSGNSGPGGAGGSGGSNGLTATHPGGLGQGSYIASLSLFTENTLTAGLGGAAGSSSHSGGGGGGGILINGLGPVAGNGLASFSAFGGVGYGAGGGAGGYHSPSGPSRVGGGNGANGLVYLEFTSAAAVPEPSSIAMIGIGTLCMLVRRFRRTSTVC